MAICKQVINTTNRKDVVMQWLIGAVTYFVIVGFGPLIAIAIRERRETRRFVRFMERAWGDQ